MTRLSSLVRHKEEHCPLEKEGKTLKVSKREELLQPQTCGKRRQTPSPSPKKNKATRPCPVTPQSKSILIGGEGDTSDTRTSPQNLVIFKDDPEFEKLLKCE